MAIRRRKWKCVSCGKLLCIIENGVIDIKYRDLSLKASDEAIVDIVCHNCKKPNRVNIDEIEGFSSTVDLDEIFPGKIGKVTMTQLGKKVCKSEWAKLFPSFFSSISK